MIFLQGFSEHSFSMYFACPNFTSCTWSTIYETTSITLYIQSVKSVSILLMHETAWIYLIFTALSYLQKIKYFFPICAKGMKKRTVGNQKRPLLKSMKKVIHCDRKQIPGKMTKEAFIPVQILIQVFWHLTGNLSTDKLPAVVQILHQRFDATHFTCHLNLSRFWENKSKER